MKAKPKCPECGKSLKKSKLNIDVWICNDCNEVFKDEQVNLQKSLKNFNLKTGRFDNV